MLIGTRQRIGDFVSLPTIGLCLDGVQIMNSNTYTYLGVHFDSFLTFDKMTDKICNKLSGRVAMLYRMSNYMPYYHLLSMYYAFIQPHLFGVLLPLQIYNDINVFLAQYLDTYLII